MLPRPARSSTWIICCLPLGYADATVIRQPWVRRHVLCGAAATALAPSRAASALPPATVVLRAAEVCYYQEELLYRSASASEQERIDHSLLIGRQQMPLSVSILIANTKMEQIRGAEGAVASLRGAAKIAEVGEGPLTSLELSAMAKQYRAAQVWLGALRSALDEHSRDDCVRARIS